MITLTLVLCLIGGPCREELVPGSFASMQACWLHGQAAAIAWLDRHPSETWILNKWRCGAPEPPA